MIDDDLKEAMFIVGVLILFGWCIGSILHYWPLPVNNSVMIKDESR